MPNEKEAARKLKVQAARFVLIKDVLYKRGFSRLYLRCLGNEEADYIIREVHEGICGNHSGLRSLVHKLVWAGYYWLPCKRMPKLMLRPATNVRGSATLFSNQPRS